GSRFESVAKSEPYPRASTALATRWAPALPPTPRAMAVRSRLLSGLALCAAAALLATAASTGFVPAPAAARTLHEAGANHAAVVGVALAANPSAAYAAKDFDPVDTVLRVVAIVTILIGPIVGFGLIPVIFGRDVSTR
ncbi:unnamed protein product, partial [Prorocentrum cordatum]